MAATLLNSFCNIFGGENDNVKTLGGLGSAPKTRWFCKNRAAGRYVMTCPHGHRGQIMEPCADHLAEFADKVSFCPPCNVKGDHKCRLRIREVS